MPLAVSRAAVLIATVLATLAPRAHADIRTQTRAPKAPTAVSIVIDYQRVGHDLLALQEQRGFFDCGDLVPRFRAIKLEPSLATPATRTATAAALAEIATKIERLRGIQVHTACLENPLAEGCK